MKQYRTLKCNDFFEITNRISSTYKNKTEGGNPSSVNLCGRRESNPYASRHQILSLACLPISTRPQTFYVISFRKRNANILLIFETASMNLRHADSSLPLYEYYSHQRQSYDCHSRADRKINSEIHMSSDQICYKQEARSHC